MPHTRPNFVKFSTLAALVVAVACLSSLAVGQSAETSGATQFRVGERLTYVLSTDGFFAAVFERKPMAKPAKADEE